MNKYLEQDIRIKLSKLSGEPITKEDFEKVTELGLNNFTFSNKPKNIDLSEIQYFPNIQLLTLQKFELSDIDLRILSELESLITLQIVSCKILSKNLYKFPLLQNIIISTSEFSDFPKIFLPKLVTINGINRAINLSLLHGIERIEKLRLTNIKKISRFDMVSKMHNLKELNIDGSHVDNKKVLEELNKKIPVSHKSKFIIK